MSARIWELHARLVGDAIRTTAEGDADIDGLILSEKAYLLVVRDFRPQALVERVRRDGAARVADDLISHFAAPTAVQASAGRTLVRARGRLAEMVLRRSDEVVAAPALARIT